MEEELPLVDNIDEEADHLVLHDEEDNHASGINEEPILEQEVNSQEVESDNLEHDAGDNDALEDGNLDEPNLDDQQLLIYVEGAPDYPNVQPRDNDDLINRDVRENVEEDVENDRNVMLIDLRHQRVRRIERHINMFADGINEGDVVESDSDEDDTDADDGQEEESVITVTSSSDGEASQGEEDQQEERESFDTELPAQHQYMGESREVAGRIILEEDLYVDIPVISQPGIILMPGQTLPMTFFQPAVISMMKRLVETTKTFGVLHKR